MCEDDDDDDPVEGLDDEEADVLNNSTLGVMRTDNGQPLEKKR